MDRSARSRLVMMLAIARVTREDRRFQLGISSGIDQGLNGR